MALTKLAVLAVLAVAVFGEKVTRQVAPVNNLGFSNALGYNGYRYNVGAFGPNQGVFGYNGFNGFNGYNGYNGIYDANRGFNGYNGVYNANRGYNGYNGVYDANQGYFNGYNGLNRGYNGYNSYNGYATPYGSFNYGAAPGVARPIVAGTAAYQQPQTVLATRHQTNTLARQDAEYDPNPQYTYSYNINDPITGDAKTQTESRNGDVVQGSYSLIEADGSKRTVEYTADPVSGFNAVVRKEEGAAPPPPAPVNNKNAVNIPAPFAYNGGVRASLPAVATASPSLAGAIYQGATTYPGAPAISAYTRPEFNAGLPYVAGQHSAIQPAFRANFGYPSGPSASTTSFSSGHSSYAY